MAAPDDILWNQVSRPDDADAAAALLVPQAIREGANVNMVRYDWTPLMKACGRQQQGSDRMVGILLEAGADARWRNYDGCSAIYMACFFAYLSTVQRLIHHDNGLVEMTNNKGWTPLFCAVHRGHVQIVRFLLDSGANPHHRVEHTGETALMIACRYGRRDNVRLLLAAGVDVEVRDEEQKAALHHAAFRGDVEVMRELILQHNANMFAVDKYRRTPFDLVCISSRSDDASVNPHLELYGNKLTHDHGRLALHELLKVAKYSFSEDPGFHPPLNPLRIILPLGTLTLQQFRTLLRTLDPELMIRHPDDTTGTLPIHVACQANAPVEILAMLVERDPATLHRADHAGALPVHSLCRSCCCGKGVVVVVVEYASLRYVVEQGGVDGVDTLAARNQEGALPLHVLLCGSTHPSWRAVQYLMQSSPGSVAMRTNAGRYPFMIVATDSSWASLSVVYELVRADPGLVAAE